MDNYLNKIIRGDALVVLRTMPDKSIDCCITSPPYYKLRDYESEGQIGQEDTPEEFIDKLCDIFDEVKRVLKSNGTCWVNLGDSYNTVSGRMVVIKRGGKSARETAYGSKVGSMDERGLGGLTEQVKNYPRKSLFMIPSRFAIEMVRRGWILRNEIIWQKDNQMPSNAKDRFTVDFEKLFFFVKKPVGYYFRQQLEPVKETSLRRAEYGWHGKVMKNGHGTAGMKHIDKMGVRFANPDGRNMRTVWNINTRGCSEEHFAGYPQRLVEKPILAGCPEGGLVLDPFMGNGTTAVVAKKMGRDYLGIEINEKYIEAAQNRIYKELGMFL